MLSDHLPRTVQLKDGSSAVLRNASADDAAGLVEFVQGIDSESDFLNRFPGEFQVTVEQERDFLTALIDSATDHMVVAEIDDCIAGNGHLSGSPLKRFAHHAELALAVRQAYWGRGLGGHILGCLIDHCRARKLRKAWLQVMDHNDRGIHLYKSFGFELEGRARGDILRADGSYGDLLRMGLHL